MRFLAGTPPGLEANVPRNEKKNLVRPVVLWPGEYLVDFGFRICWTEPLDPLALADPRPAILDC